MDYKNPNNRPYTEKFCENYHKHYVLLYVGEFNRWTAWAVGAVCLTGIIVVWIVKG